MPPKSALTAEQRRLLCLQWIQKSGVAHTLKDLEKALPSVASINSMHVKEYVQALMDENQIRVEKIGSGNWYWSFLSDEKIRKEQALTKAKTDHDKALVAVEELQQRVDEAGTAREEDDDDMLMEAGNDRKSLTLKYGELVKELDKLRTELAAYSENDPVEVEKSKTQIESHKRQVEKYTDQILSMEGWMKKRVGGDRVQYVAMKKSWYGDEFDEEAGGLKEI